MTSKAYLAFNKFWNTGRRNTETVKRSESRFSAHVAKTNSVSSAKKLPEHITSFNAARGFRR